MLGLMTLERIFNPVQKDYVTFLETAESSGGERSLLEVELSPGGGVAPHYHSRFSETFKAISGDLSLLLDKETLVLSQGQAVRADIGVMHRFFNASDKAIIFQVELNPGNRDFENALRAGYGLASAGRTNSKSMPKNPLELAVMAEWSNTVMPGLTATIVTPIFNQLLRIAKKRQVDKRLLETYCEPT